MLVVFAASIPETPVLRALLVSLLLAAGPDSSPQIHLDARELPSCFNRGRIRYALETQLGDQILGGTLETSPTLTLGLSGPDELQVLLVDPGGARLGERTLEITPAECPQLPRTIALMVEAWLQGVPSPLLPEPTPSVLHPFRGRDERRASPGSLQMDAMPKEQEPARQPPQSPGDPSPEVAPVHALASTTSEPDPPLALSLSLLAGGQVLGDAQNGGFHGAAGLSLSRAGGLGVALVSSFDSAVASSDPTGRVECSTQDLDLLLQLRSAIAESTSFSFLIGPSAQRLAAASEGFSTNGSAIRYDFGAAALGQWEQQLVSRLSLIVAVRAGIRLHDDTFRVSYSDGRSTTLELDPLRLSASAGLSWRLF